MSPVLQAVSFAAPNQTSSLAFICFAFLDLFTSFFYLLLFLTNI